MKKKIVSLVMSVLLAFSMIPMNAFAQDTEKTAHVIVENTTFAGGNLNGTIIDTDVRISDGESMMGAIETAFVNANGMLDEDSGYIKGVIDRSHTELKETDGGPNSGWMGSINDWFPNQGFDNITVNPGDEIKLMYTCNLGADIGADFNDTSTKIIKTDFTNGSLSPAFSQDINQYTIDMQGKNSLSVKAYAHNKNFQIHIFNGGEEVKRGAEFIVKSGDEITIKCGDPSWPGSSAETVPTTYTYTVKNAGNIAPKANNTNITKYISLGNPLNLNLSELFTDPENDNLSYTVAINGGNPVAALVNYSYNPTTTGVTTLTFTAKDKLNSSDSCTVTLNCSSGEKHNITTENSSNGKITVDATSKEGGNKVTVTAKPDDGYGLCSLEIKDSKNNKIDLKTLNFEDNQYSFIMPDDEVTVSSEFSKIGNFELDSINNSKTYQSAKKSTDGITPCIIDSMGNKIFLTDKLGYKYKTNIPYGHYTYQYFDSDKNVTAQGEFDFSADNKILKLMEIRFLINFDDQQGDYNHKTDLSFKDQDGNELKGVCYEDENGNIDNEGTFIHYSFVTEYKNKDYQYTYNLNLKDKNLDLENKTGTVTNPRSSWNTNAWCIPGQMSPFTPYSTLDPVTFKVSKGADFGIYKKINGHYAPFYEYTPCEKDLDSDPDYDIYKYKIPKSNGITIHSIADGNAPDGSKYLRNARIFKGIDKDIYTIDLQKLDNNIKKGCAYSTTFGDLSHPETLKKLYDTTEDDMYLNVPDSNFINLDLDENTYFDLRGYRVNQAQEGFVANYFIEPDFHYEILSGDSVETEETGEEGDKHAYIYAIKPGTSIIRVTYDAMELKNGSSDYAYFNSCDPINQRTIVVNVTDEAANSTITPNIKEREYDTIYFTKSTVMPNSQKVDGTDHAEYTFTPSDSDNIEVSTHKPVLDGGWDDNWTSVAKNSDGSFTANLYSGENIVKITKGEEVSYYVISAKGITVNIANETNPGCDLSVGDTATVSFDALNLPNKKMSGIYNPGFPDTTWDYYNCDSSEVSQKGLIPDEKITDGIVRHKGLQYIIEDPLCNKISFKLLKSGTINLTDGKIHSEHLGSPLGTHRILDGTGIAPNLNASNNTANADFSTLPDISLKVKERSVTDIYNDTENYLKAKDTFDVGSVSGEWAVLGLSRSTNTVPDDYFKNVENYISKNINEKSQLSKNKSTENSRVILALTAAGKDPTDFAGHNLLKGLSDLNYINYQGINGPIFALIALDSHNYNVETVDAGGVQATRENLIDSILKKQNTDGGWSLMGSESDVDLSAMAIQSLSHYYNSNDSVKSAVDKALTLLSRLQKENGNFASYGQENCESTAQVIVALTSLGINPATDTRFIKNDINPIEALTSFSISKGGFSHTSGEDLNEMSTEQGFYSLVSYYRLLNNKTSLYDMSDVELSSYKGSGQSSVDTNTNKPTILEGENANFTIGSKDGLTVRSSAPLKDLINVLVDGNVISNDKYTTAEGSTIVKLKPQYLETLSVGKHTIDIQSVGGTASTEFTILANPTDNASTKDDTAKKDETVKTDATTKTENTVKTANTSKKEDTANTEDTKSPKTGDNSNMIVLVCLLFITGGSITTITVAKKRRKQGKN